LKYDSAAGALLDQVVCLRDVLEWEAGQDGDLEVTFDEGFGQRRGGGG
jgi:hypothetical protein